MTHRLRIRECECRAAWMQASPSVRTGWEKVSRPGSLIPIPLFSLFMRRWRRVGRVVRITHCLSLVQGHWLDE